MAVVTVGNAATDRNQAFLITGKTTIDYTTAADLDGTINSVQLWLNSGFQDGVGVKIAIFEEVAANTFTAKAVNTIGAVTKGSAQTFPVSLAIKAGYYIGIYDASGAPDEARIELSTDAGGAIYSVAGDQTACVATLFSKDTDRVMSLIGTGVTAAKRGWAMSK